MDGALGKKYSANFSKLPSQLVYKKIIHHISAKISNTLSIGKKSHFKCQTGVYFGKKSKPLGSRHFF